MLERMKGVSVRKKNQYGASRFAVILFAASLVSSCLIGCVQQPPPPPPPPSRESEPPQPEMLVHEVKYQGETLALIASWYTGRSTNWTIIRDANPGLRPERMNLGMFIKIPGYLVTQWEPLPRRLVQDSRGGRNSQPTSNKGTEDESLRPRSTEDFDSPTDSNDFESVFERAMQDSPPAEAAVPNAVVEERVVIEEPSPPPPTPTKAPEAGTGSGDAERERLLDELLTQ